MAIFNSFLYVYQAGYSLVGQKSMVASAIPFGLGRVICHSDCLAGGFPSGLYDLMLGLFKVIFYFPNGKSTIWGIYSEYFLFFGHPLSKSK